MRHDVPVIKRVVAFFDCQNLFKSSKNLWGYSFPNFDPIKLAYATAAKYKNDSWKIEGIRLYTGIPDKARDFVWHEFWNRKLSSHKASNPRVSYYTTPLRYTNNVAREKGVDIRIALDLVRMARKNEYDIALLFSQDNDFSEAAQEIREIANEYDRWIKIVSAYPYEPNSNTRGVDKTDWIPLSRVEYDSCIDTKDYRVSLL